MKTIRIILYSIMVVSLAAILPSCKAKKLAAKPAAPAETVNKPVAKPTPPPAPAPVAQPAPPPAKPDFNFSNVQFDFNSSVLRTDAIQYLDHIVSEMKKAPTTKFILNGNASSEGTASHNMALSIDRANAVKQYLTNAGINASDLSTKGYGAKKPIASNKTESGKEKNRRVEVKLIQ